MPRWKGERVTISELETCLSVATQSTTVEWGRIRYAAGQVFVDFPDNHRERIDIGQVGNVLRDAPWDSEDRFLAERARFQVPPEALQDLATLLRKLFGDYIAPEVDRIGHGFPISGGRNSYAKALKSGLRARGYATPVPDFAKSLVRASVALDASHVAAMLEGWLDDRPLRVQTSAILAGIRTTEDLVLPEGVVVQTLPAASDSIPLSVPHARKLPVLDVLGTTLLTVDSFISKPLFQPRGDFVPGSVVQLQTDERFLSVRALCDALALITGRFVRPSLFWTDYSEASAFGATGDDIIWRAGDPFVERWNEIHTQTDRSSGVVTLRHRLPEPPLISKCDLRSAWEFHAKLAERKANDVRFKTALERWLRSLRADLSLADHFIDLRVALEALYLDNSRDELVHRLCTRLAWHLGSSPKERRRHFEATRKFYNRASSIVHGGEVKDAEADEQLLDQASLMCRQALFARVNAGPPDWDTLVFGV